MYSSYDHKWVDLGSATNNLCKNTIIPFEGVQYSFNKEGLLSGEIPLREVDKIAKYIATIYKLPYIVIVGTSSGWYIKYNSASDILTDSSRISFCRVIERH